MAYLSFPPPSDHQEFERLVLEIARARWRDALVALNGRSGQRQHGVDINVQRRDGTTAGIQCKLTTQQLTIAIIADEIEKARGYEPLVDQYIVATTSPSDAGLQREIRLLPKEEFTVELWSWAEINVDLNRLAPLGLDYAQQVLLGSSVKLERDHAANIREALDRPAFLHPGHAERNFLEQSKAVKDTAAFLRTGYLYTRDGLLVSQLPYLRYSEDYSKALSTIVSALDRFDVHLSRNMQDLLDDRSPRHVEARIGADKYRLQVLTSSNKVFRKMGVEEVIPTA